MVKLTNISGGLLVCDIKNGDTLRLNNKQSNTYPDSAITKHIEHLVSSGLVRKVVVKEKTKTVEKAATKREKEENQNGTV